MLSIESLVIIESIHPVDLEKWKPRLYYYYYYYYYCCCDGVFHMQIRLPQPKCFQNNELLVFVVDSPEEKKKSSLGCCHDHDDYDDHFLVRTVVDTVEQVDVELEKKNIVVVVVVVVSEKWNEIVMNLDDGK